MNPVDAGEDACRWCGVWLIRFDPMRVPEPFRSLLPVARRWGIGDDGYRWDAIEAASAADLSVITEAVDRGGDALYDWLAGSEAVGTPTNEYVALTCLTVAYDEARLR
jgi:hypothetical protein